MADDINKPTDSELLQFIFEMSDINWGDEEMASDRMDMDGFYGEVSINMLIFTLYGKQFQFMSDKGSATVLIKAYHETREYVAERKAKLATYFQDIKPITEL